MSYSISRRKIVVASSAIAVAGRVKVLAQESTPEADVAADPIIAEEPVSIRVGATPVPHAEILNFIQENLSEERNLTIEVIEFTDYVQPNTALDEGELDANYFQHLPYLEEFNDGHGTSLVPVVAVHIEPLGVYSESITDLSEIEGGAIVGIPNDVTNGGRALKLLEDNGLIELDPDIQNPTVIDVVENPLNLEFAELEAAQLPRSLPDTTISVINGNYAIEAGFTPADDALALESGEDNPYANYLVVNEGNEEELGVQILAQLLTTDDVRAFIEENYEGSVIAAF